MPIPEDLVKVNITFALTDVDVAVMGFHMRRDHVPTNPTDWPTDVNTIATKVRDEWVANVTAAPYGHGTIARDVSVYHLDTAGHALDKGLALFTGETAWRGSGENTLPWECSVVVTLLGYTYGDFVANPARKRGRYYLPPTQYNVISGDAGAVVGPSAAALRDDQAAFIAAVKRFNLTNGPGPAADDAVDMGILSRRDSAFVPLVGAYIDNQMDVQKRRQNKQTPVKTQLDIS